MDLIYMFVVALLTHFSAHPRLCFSAPTAPASTTYTFELTTPDSTRALSGVGALVPLPSPFGVAVSTDGHLRYDLHLSIQELPAPSAYGASYTTYVAWMVTPLMDARKALGVVRSGEQSVGEA